MKETKKSQGTLFVIKSEREIFYYEPENFISTERAILMVVDTHETMSTMFDRGMEKDILTTFSKRFAKNGMFLCTNDENDHILKKAEPDYAKHWMEDFQENPSTSNLILIDYDANIFVYSFYEEGIKTMSANLDKVILNTQQFSDWSWQMGNEYEKSKKKWLARNKKIFKEKQGILEIDHNNLLPYKKIRLQTPLYND